MNADTLLGRTKRLFSHNVFSYCCQNPIAFIDVDGRAVTVNIYTSGAFDIGHCDVSINGMIYTYGRYEESWGPLGAFGPGILIVCEEEFLIEQQRVDKGRDVIRIILDFSKEEEERFQEYYTELINSGYLRKETKNNEEEPTRFWYGFEAGHPFATYFLMGPNCTTVVSDAINHAIKGRKKGDSSPGNGGMPKVVVPGQMPQMLSVIGLILEIMMLSRKKKKK